MTLARSASSLGFEHISAQALHTLQQAATELALLDVRPHGIYARSHLLRATSLPLERIELKIATLVPRRETPVVLIGLDDHHAQAAAKRLQDLGYSRLFLLEQGIAGWEAAGYTLFSGTNVPSKAFGEALEHQLDTPHIDAVTLKQKLDNQENVVVVDSRTPEEFHRFSIPGAYSVPGAELVYRIGVIAPDPETLVVVNCAGRTRSIVGAQTLINAGIPNRVVSLQNGTMAWLQEGYTLNHGHHRPAPAPYGPALAQAQAQARDSAERAGVNFLTTPALEALTSNANPHTVYRFDIRTREEFIAGHLPGWRWAPGGQLVQATDEYAATRHAHIVLADWDGVRALTTAALLTQLGGYQVHVYPVALNTNLTLETGEPQHIVVRADAAPTWITVSDLAALGVGQGARVLDIDNSVAFEEAHISGAEFVATHQVLTWVHEQGEHIQAKPLVLTSSDGLLARNLVNALRDAGVSALALLGGTRAWIAAGRKTTSLPSTGSANRDDINGGPYVYKDEAERNANFNAYLDWEIDLVAQLERDGSTRFDLSGSRSSHA